MRTEEQTQFKITFRNAGRNTLANLLVTFASLGVLTSLTLVTIGIAVHATVKPYRLLLDKYDGAYLSMMLVGIGVTSIPVHLLLIFLLVDFNKHENADHFSRILLSLLIAAIFTAASGITCFVHIKALNKSFKTGLESGMQKYKVRTKALTMERASFYCTNIAPEIAILQLGATA